MERAKGFYEEVGEDWVYREKKIDEMVDTHESYLFGKNRVDIYYGLKRVYLTLRRSKDVCKKFAEFLVKNAKLFPVRGLTRIKE